MLANTPERQMRFVRGWLFLGWMVLLLSLIWDPLTIHLIDPGNPESLLSLGDEPVYVQGELVTPEAEPLGTTLFWALIVPLVPLFLLVFGHETWRRICPLSFVSQIPRMLGLQRHRRKLDRQNGRIRALLALPNKKGWLRAHALDIQFGLLFVGLNLRLLFVNADPTALAIFFALLLIVVLFVGWYWGGKTWCNYFCPLAVVQKVYTGPGGLLDSRPHLEKSATPQSMCRKPGEQGDVSTCVGCTPQCPDIDRERSYWEGLHEPALKRMYFGLFGLIVGFYGYYYLYSGSWDYYFSGIWTLESGHNGTLFSPGLYLNDQVIPIPKIIAVPLVIGLAVGLSIMLWSLLEKAYFRLAARWSLPWSHTQLTHHVLTVSAFASINTFYLFGGRPMLSQLSDPAVRAVDIAVVLLSTVWLVRSLRRSWPTYRQESVSGNLRQQLSGLQIDFPKLLDGRDLNQLTPGEVYVLARTLPEFDQTRRLDTYKTVIEELLRNQQLDDPDNNELLAEMRSTLGLSEAEHQQILLDLGLTDFNDPDQAGVSAVVENHLRRDNFRVAFEALLLSRLTPGQQVRELAKQMYREHTVQTLIEQYQIDHDEFAQAVTEIAGMAGMLYERGLKDLDALQAEAALAFSLRQATVNQSAQVKTAAELLLREYAAERSGLIERLLTVLAAIDCSPATERLAQQLVALNGSEVTGLLQQPVSAGLQQSWAQVLPERIAAILAGKAHLPHAPEGGGITSYGRLIAQSEPLAGQLKVLLEDGSRRAALALWLAAVLDAENLPVRSINLPPQANDWFTALRNQLDASRQATPVLPEAMAISIGLSRSALFSGLRLVELARLAEQSQLMRYPQGEALFTQGEPQRALFVLNQGAVGDADGQMYQADQCGHVFAAGALLRPEQHSTTIISHSEQTSVIVIPLDRIQSLLTRFPQMAATIYAQLATGKLETTRGLDV